MQVKLLSVSLAISASLMSCDSSKEANKDNFKAVIDGYHERKCILV